MRQKINSYLPIWVVLMVPPMLLILIGWNFVTSGLGLIIALFILNISDGFTKYSKKVFKLWGISLLLDLIVFALLLIPEIFYKIDFINDNLVTPLEYNPYTKVLSILYMIIVFVVALFVAIKLVKKFILNDIVVEKKRYSLAYFVIIIFVLPYLLFVPSTFVIEKSKNNIEDFKGTIMGNKSDVVTILKYLSVSDSVSSYVLDTHVEPYTITLYMNPIDIKYLEKFELDASTIFNLINDVNEVKYIMGDNTYKYSLNDINKIFGDVKDEKLSEIFNHYSDNKFNTYTYLGMVGRYKAFDTSEVCEEVLQKLFVYNNVTYYLECSSLDSVILYDKAGDSVKLKDALNKKLINEKDVLDSFLKVESREHENTN